MTVQAVDTVSRSGVDRKHDEDAPRNVLEGAHQARERRRVIDVRWTIVAVGDRSACGRAWGQVFSRSEGCLNHPAFEPLDTTADARDVQREAYRRLGGVGRMAILFRLTALVRETALAGIRSRHPGYDEAQVQMAWRRLVVGDDLARKAWPDRELVDP